MEEREVERGALGAGEAPPQQIIPRDEQTELSSISLYSYHEIPNFLKGNPYITDGYRAYLTPDLCAKSTFMWTNETINIWSHLLGLAYFLMLMLDDNLLFLPSHGAHWGDYVTFNILSICFQACMLCSAGYHMFMCQSELVSRRWLGLDMAGVSLGLCGCYFPGAYYAFYCDRFWQIFYMVIMCTLALCSLFAQTHPHFLSTHWSLRRLALYSAVLFGGFVPVAHWVVRCGGFQHPLVQILMPRVVVMYVIGVIGGTFFVSKFPESFFPGKLNYLGSSHQWWHLMVVLAFGWGHHLAVAVFLYWKAHECPATDLHAPDVMGRELTGSNVTTGTIF